MSQLRVDDRLCVGHGRCYFHAPDLLEFDDDGFVVPRDEDIPVPVDQDAEAKQAAGACPERAITYST